MVFNELIRQILSEQDCDEHKLAHELDCTPVQIRNLRDGKSKLPNSNTCRKIFRYCDRYGIDYSFIDWNDIAYTLFIDQDWISEYTWLEDLDSSNYITLKHNKCGKTTKVPFSTFNAVRTTPCIHCWVQKYVPLDSYTVELSEDSCKHKFTHSCGYSYDVTYEQIKQKKFKCVRCGAMFNGNKEAEIRTRDYSFIGRQKLPQYWMDYDYLERYLTRKAQNGSTVWFKVDLLNTIGRIILQKAILDVEITEDTIEHLDVYYSKFLLSDYLEYCKQYEDEAIEVDNDKYPEEKNFLIITAKLMNGECFNLGYITDDLIIHNKIGYVVYGTVGDDDKLVAKAIKNSKFYEELPPMELQNLKVLIRENRARQDLYLLYKSFADTIEIEAETLTNIDKQIEALKLKQSMMEALYSFNNLIESTNKKPLDEDDEDIFDDDEFIDEDFDLLDEDDENNDDEEDDNTPPPTPTQLSDLPNLGASMVRRLGAIGIFSIDELMQAQTEEVWDKLFEKASFTDCVEIWSIEGAKQGVLYAELDDERKAELKEYVRMKKGREKPNPEELTTLPNIGVSLAEKLKSIGIATSSTLKGETSEAIWDRLYDAFPSVGIYEMYAIEGAKIGIKMKELDGTKKAQISDYVNKRKAKMIDKNAEFVAQRGDIKELVLEMTLEELEFPIRIYNCLKRAGINTVRDLTEKTLDDIVKVRNLGRHHIEPIVSKLQLLGLKLKSDEA